MLAVEGSPGAGKSTFGGGAWASLRDIGELDIHGLPVTTWARVDRTVIGCLKPKHQCPLSSKQVHVTGKLEWASNAEIVLTNPPEVLAVGSTQFANGKTVLTLRNPARKTHISLQRTVNGVVLDLRSEIGLLSRNIVIQGSYSRGHSEHFGAHTIAKRDSEYRIEFAEFRACGQAGFTGRHCVHFEQLGVVPPGSSYARGLSVHRGWNRAISLTRTSEIEISSNVAYKVEGHVYSQSDEFSMHNQFINNLGVLGTKTLACGKSDCKPGIFGVYNPENFWRGNVAADGEKYGFGWAMPCGSDASRKNLLEMRENTMHGNSVGMNTGCSYAPTADTQFIGNTYFGNSNGGAYHKKMNFHAHHVDSRFAWNGNQDITWMVYMSGGSLLDPQLRDCTFLGSDETGGGAIYGPKNEFFYVSGASFEGYGSTPAIKGCAGCCCLKSPAQGAYTYRWERLWWNDSDAKVGWACPYKQIHFDMDGTLTGVANGSVTSYKKYNDWSDTAACNRSNTEFSGGIVCDDTVRIRRLFVDKVDPMDLDSKPVFLKKSNRTYTSSGSATEVYGGLNWTLFAETGQLYDGHCTDLRPSVMSGPGCLAMDHMDYVAFRDADDGYGWALPVVTDHDYYFDFGATSIDFETMRLSWSHPLYISRYGSPSDAVMLKFNYINYRYRFDVEHAGQQSLPWHDRRFSNCVGTKCNIAPQGSVPLSRSYPFGEGYMLRSDESMKSTKPTGEWWLSLNPNAGHWIDSVWPRADALQLVINRKQCGPGLTHSGCSMPPPSLEPLGRSLYWSEIETWQLIAGYKEMQLLGNYENMTGSFPTTAQHVEIPSGVDLILDVPPCADNVEPTKERVCIPKLGRLTIVGSLTFQDGAPRTVDCDAIVVWGSLNVGTRDRPFRSPARIRLHGDVLSDTIVISDDHEIGSKAIAVFGALNLHGIARNHSLARLTRTISPGDTTIRLDRSVDWHIGDKVVISPTSYVTDPHNSHSEVVAVRQVSANGRTIMLATAVSHRHAVASINTRGDEFFDDVTLAPAVGLLTGKSVVLEGVLSANEAAAGVGFGFHIYAGEFVVQADGGSSEIENLNGVFDISGVELYHCGKTNFASACINMKYLTGFANKYHVFDWLTKEQGNVTRIPNSVEDSSFHHSLSSAVKGAKAVAFTFRGNVVHNTFGDGIRLDKDSEDCSIAHNLIVGNYRVPNDVVAAEFCQSDRSCVVTPFAAIYIEAERTKELSYNTIAGVEDTGIVAHWGVGCNGKGLWGYPEPPLGSKGTLFSGNEVFSAMVGVRVLPAPGILADLQCIGIQDVKVWMTTDVGILTLDQLANIHVSRVVLSDNHVGISLNFIRAGSDSMVSIEDSIVAATTAASPCPYNINLERKLELDGHCRTYGVYDTLATARGDSCNTVFGGGVRRIGIALPRYTNLAQTCGGSGSKEICRPVTKPVKQCAVPWLKRFGRLQAKRARLRVANTFFYGFRVNDCMKKTKAISGLPDEINLWPDMEFSNLRWHKTEPRSRISLAADGINGGGGDAVKHSIVRDLDGTTFGESLKKLGVNPADGGNVVTAAHSGLVDFTSCVREKVYGAHICKSSYRYAHVSLQFTKKLAPIKITRTVRDRSKTYTSSGNSDERCSSQKKSPLYPFKVALVAGAVYRISPAGATTPQGRFTWYAEKDTDTVVIQLYMAQSFDSVQLFIDSKRQTDNKLDDSSVPTTNSPPGSWSYSARRKLLSFVMHGWQSEFQWLGQMKPDINVKLAAIIDIPPLTSPSRKAAIADEYGTAVVRAISRRLNIPMSRWKVVCVHEKGQPCLKNRARRVALDRMRRNSYGGNSTNVTKNTTDGDTANSTETEVSSETGQIAYDVEAVVEAPNNDTMFNENGTETSAYVENTNFASNFSASFEDLVSSGELADELSNITNTTNATIIGIQTESDLADNDFSAVGNGSSFAVVTSLSGLCFVDTDGDGTLGDNDTAAELAGVTILLLANGALVHSTKVEADGTWAFDAVKKDLNFTVTIKKSTLPNLPDGLTWGDAPERHGVVKSEPSVGLLLPQVKLQTIYGLVRDSAGAGLAAVTVEGLTVAGELVSTTTADDGTWSLITAAGPIIIDVDESTLPLLQPYTAAATSANDPIELTSAAVAGLIGTGIETVYQPFGEVTVTLWEEYIDTNSSLAEVGLEGVTVQLGASSGAIFSAEPGVGGFTVLQLPLGTFNQADLVIPGCLYAGEKPADQTLEVLHDASVDLGSWKLDCTDNCKSKNCTGLTDHCIDQVHSAVCSPPTMEPTLSPSASPTTLSPSTSPSGAPTSKPSRSPSKREVTLHAVMLDIVGNAPVSELSNGDLAELTTAIVALFSQNSIVRAADIYNITFGDSEAAALNSVVRRSGGSVPIYAAVVLQATLSGAHAEVAASKIMTLVTSGSDSLEVGSVTFFINAATPATASVFADSYHFVVVPTTPETRNPAAVTEFTTTTGGSAANATDSSSDSGDDTAIIATSVSLALLFLIVIIAIIVAVAVHKKKSTDNKIAPEAGQFEINSPGATSGPDRPSMLPPISGGPHHLRHDALANGPMLIAPERPPSRVSVVERNAAMQSTRSKLAVERSRKNQNAALEAKLQARLQHNYVRAQTADSVKRQAPRKLTMAEQEHRQTLIAEMLRIQVTIHTVQKNCVGPNNNPVNDVSR